MDAERAAGPTMGDSSPILIRDGKRILVIALLTCAALPLYIVWQYSWLCVFGERCWPISLWLGWCPSVFDCHRQFSGNSVFQLGDVGRCKQLLLRVGETNIERHLSLIT